MTKARPQVLSLNGGEVDPEAIARSDIDSYANKAARYENALPAVKGGLYRAPGSRFIGRTLPFGDNGDLPAIVRTWRFSRAQAFTLELSHMVMRIVFGTGYVATGPGVGLFASWVDDSTAPGTTLPMPPTWDPGPGSPTAPPSSPVEENGEPPHTPFDPGDR